MIWFTMRRHLKKIIAKLKENNLTGLLVSYPPNISYLTGYTSRDAYLLVSKKQNFYITDSRYTEEAKAQLGKEFSVIRADGSAFKIISQICGKQKIKRLGFEEQRFSYAGYKKLKESLPRNIILAPAGNITESLRQVKSTAELKRIKKAIRITIKALEFIKNYLRPGKREIEVAAELEYFIKNNGAEGAAFEIIVASGPNSSFPHHVPSRRKIRKNDLVLIDIGVNYRGYKSDLTRVFFLGKMTILQRKIFDLVQKAQEKAIKEIKPAVEISKVDTAARQYISQNGYGGFFGHALGHGVGLEVHEAPNISGKTKDKLEPGMVFTVEPAIYLPHKFGIRLEDMVLVTKNKVEVLSGALDK